jgi:hypothetical protein
LRWLISNRSLPRPDVIVHRPSNWRKAKPGSDKEKKFQQRARIRAVGSQDFALFNALVAIDGLDRAGVAPTEPEVVMSGQLLDRSCRWTP